MKIVIFGLTISSSWGNGHATLWRALCRSLHRRGHIVTFFERDVPYYAAHRDLWQLPGAGGDLVLYGDWPGIIWRAQQELASADVAMVTSYCPDAVDAAALVLDSNVRVKSFYDLDTPVTLGQLAAGHAVSYIPPYGFGDFDVVLSYTGGRALTELRDRLGARRVVPIYGSVDPSVHHPSPPQPHYSCDLSYLGTYAEDRQPALNRLLVEPARHLPDRRFVIGGAQYPANFPWADNIYFVRHLPPAEHPAFFSSCRATLNVTRKAMADMGYCPSGRLFEAAACGTAMISDDWEGLGEFFTPGREIIVAHTTDDVIRCLQLSDRELKQIADAGRQRTLDEHTSDHRAADLESALESAASPFSPPPMATAPSPFSPPPVAGPKE